MAYEDKPGTGAIFKNNKLKDTHPDYRGNIVTPTGEKLDISLWLRESKSGIKYFSVAVQVPFKKEESADQSDNRSEPSTEDDLPF